jgi:hypothetical protein
MGFEWCAARNWAECRGQLGESLQLNRTKIAPTLFRSPTEISAKSLVAAMDIEDLFDAAEVPYDELVGCASESDREAIEENVQAEQFALACDLLGDTALGDPVDPATINTLKFVPTTPADFKALSTRICATCDDHPDDAKVEFVKLLITQLTRSFRPHHLQHLSDKLFAAVRPLTTKCDEISD